MIELQEVYDFLKSKGYKLEDFVFLHKGREEFDFDWHQEYYVFLLKPSNKTHGKLLIVRRIQNLGNYEEFTLERKHLIKVP